jgi:CcmD family protein
MKPLLLAGYTLLFVLFFAYTVRLQRRLTTLEQRLGDLRE